MPKQRYQDPDIKQREDGAFYIRPYVDTLDESGKIQRAKKRIILGPASMGARAAKARKAEVMATINQGAYVAKASMTVDMLLAEYESHIAKLGYATRRKYHSLIGKYIQPAWGAMGLCEVTTKRIDTWLTSLPLSWNSKTDIRNVISGMFTKAIDWGYFKERNPAEAVFVGPKSNVREKRKLTLEQTRALLVELNPVPRVVSMVSLFTTLRISEVLGLQEKHLNFERSHIEVRQRFYRGDLDKTKTDKSTRNVTMAGLDDYLKSLCTGDPERFVFQSHKSCKSDENLRKRHLSPAAKRLGIYYPGFGFHSLRREAITEIGAHVGPQVIMSMAGHTSMDLTMLYTLNEPAQQKDGATDFMKRVLQ